MKFFKKKSWLLYTEDRANIVGVVEKKTNMSNWLSGENKSEEKTAIVSKERERMIERFESGRDFVESYIS